jgi:hypothetical protein
MTTNTLSATAKKNLLDLAAGTNMLPKFRPLNELLQAGYVTLPEGESAARCWSTPKLTEAGRQAAQGFAK